MQSEGIDNDNDAIKITFQCYRLTYPCHIRNPDYLCITKMMTVMLMS